MEITLGHVHYDHTGGVNIVLQHCRYPLPVYAHPDLLRERYAIKGGQPRDIGMGMTKTYLAKFITLHLSTETLEILPFVWTTGETSDRTEFEGRSAHHYILVNISWFSDLYRDDMALVLEAKSGLVIVCGCSHAGLLNILAHVGRIFKKEIAAIVGGTKFFNVDDDTIAHVIHTISSTGSGLLPDLYLNHCTGEHVIA